MDDSTIATLLFVGVGIVFIAFGIQLLLGRVRPNFWYGCRTRKTLSDEKTWYAVNRVTGQDMVIAGVVVIVSSLVMFAFRGRLSPDQFTATLVCVLLLSVAGMAVHSLSVSSRM